LYSYPYIPGTETQWTGFNFSDPRTAEDVLRVVFGYAMSSQTDTYRLAEQFMKYMADAKPHANADPLKFNFDHDSETLSRARKIYDATSYDLSAFKARSGKILMWHGLADGGIMATSSTGYYQAVMESIGGREKTEEFFRLFLIPGVHHCFGGPRLTDFDALTALENWVEKGQPPAVLIAQRLANGAPERALPIYSYPVVPRYKQANSFVPFDPTTK
jgi:feruloyl esterase